MGLATKDQKFAIRRNCGYNDDVKCEWVQWVKKDVTQTSLNSLTFDEANQILIQQGDKPHKAEKWANFDKENSKHRAIISLAYQAQWTTETNGKTIPDLDRLSHWLQTKSPVKLPLQKQTPIELSKTIKALENVVKGIYK